MDLLDHPSRRRVAGDRIDAEPVICEEWRDGMSASLGGGVEALATGSR